MTKENPSPDLLASARAGRRRWLMGAVAGAATLGGAGLAWRANQPKPVSVVDSEPELWQRSFARPDGRSLSMTALRGQPVLLNFWATWCPPCVEELPLLSLFFTENKAKGWQVIGLAVDQLDSVKRFLIKNPVAFPVAMAGLPGIALSRSLGNLSGGLPFTVVLGSDGQVAHRKIGKVSSDELHSWLALK